MKIQDLNRLYGVFSDTGITVYIVTDDNDIVHQLISWDDENPFVNVIIHYVATSKLDGIELSYDQLDKFFQMLINANKKHGVVPNLHYIISIVN